MREAQSRESLYPETLILKVPHGTNEALRRAARSKQLTNAAYVRQLIYHALRGIKSATVCSSR